MAFIQFVFSVYLFRSSIGYFPSDLAQSAIHLELGLGFLFITVLDLNQNPGYLLISGAFFSTAFGAFLEGYFLTAIFFLLGAVIVWKRFFMELSSYSTAFEASNISMYDLGFPYKKEGDE